MFANTTAAESLKPFLSCGSGVTHENSCKLPNGEYPSFINFAGTSSRTWDGTSGNFALVGIDFEVQYDSTTDFTMTTYNNQIITGQIVVTRGWLSSTRTLTLNGVTRTFEGVDPLQYGVTSHKYFISLYALNQTINKLGIVIYNAGWLETGEDYSGSVTEWRTNLISEENVYVTIADLTPIRSFTFSSSKPDTISVWYSNNGYVTNSLNTLSKPGGEEEITFGELSILGQRVLKSVWDSYLAFVDLFIQLVYNIPVIFVLYEVVVTLLAFFNSGANIFKGIKSWWAAQKAFVRFVFYGLDIVQDHWQTFAIATGIILLGKIYTTVYGWIHFSTGGVI